MYRQKRRLLIDFIVRLLFISEPTISVEKKRFIFVYSNEKHSVLLHRLWQSVFVANRVYCCRHAVAATVRNNGTSQHHRFRC